MRNLHRWAIVLCVACSMQGLALAQVGETPDRGAPRGAPLVMSASDYNLVMNKKVQEDLKLTAKQVKDMMAAVSKVNWKHYGDPEKTRNLGPKEKAELNAKVSKEILKAVSDVLKLKPEQRKRLKQIEFQRQWQGNIDFVRSYATKELRLTNKQKQYIATIREHLIRDQTAAAFAGDREAGWKIMKKALDDVRSCLNDEQKKKLDDVMGKPFAFAEPSTKPGKPGDPVKQR
jgi:hypothetical protein